MVVKVHRGTSEFIFFSVTFDLIIQFEMKLLFCNLLVILSATATATRTAQKR